MKFALDLFETLCLNLFETLGFMFQEAFVHAVFFSNLLT